MAVTALSRRLRLPDRVATLVQAESLFNDATSLVLFQVAVAAVVSGQSGFGSATLQFVRLGGGGAVVGAAAGAVAFWSLRRERRAPVIAALDVLTPYAAAFAAAALGVSAVTAVIVTGLLVSERRGRQPESQVRRSVVAGYARVVLLLENVIFAVIGLELATFLRDLPADQRGTAAALAGLLTVALLAVRGAALAIAAPVAAAHRRRDVAPALAGRHRRDVGGHARCRASRCRVVDPADHGCRDAVPAPAAAARRRDRGRRPDPHRARQHSAPTGHPARSGRTEPMTRPRRPT